jgi:hypothetical protein
MVSPPAAVPPPTAIPQPQGSIAQPPQQNRPSPEIQKRIDSVQFCSAPPVSGGAAHNAPGPATSANARPVETYKQLCDSNIYSRTPPTKTDQPCLPEPPTPASETADSNGPKTERCADSVQFCSVLSESERARSWENDILGLTSGGNGLRYDMPHEVRALAAIFAGGWFATTLWAAPRVFFPTGIEVPSVLGNQDRTTGRAGALSPALSDRRTELTQIDRNGK